MKAFVIIGWICVLFTLVHFVIMARVSCVIERLAEKEKQRKEHDLFKVEQNEYNKRVKRHQRARQEKQADEEDQLAFDETEHEVQIDAYMNYSMKH